MKINMNLYALEYIKDSIQEQLPILREYYEEVSLIIKNKKDRLIEENNKLQEQYNDFYVEDWLLIEKMEQTFYFSITISTYTLIEQYFKKFCNNIRLYNKDSKSKKIVGVEEAIKYLKKHFKIIFDNKDLEFLRGIYAIRNVIVHNNGECCGTFEKNKTRVFNISKKVPGCKIKPIDYNNKNQTVKENQYIELEPIFVEYCLEQVEAIFRKILEQLQVLIKEDFSNFVNDSNKKLSKQSP